MTRREIFLQLLEGRFQGNQAAFARAIDRKPAQLYQWVHGLRDIGHEMARHIEKKLSLPFGFMDGKNVAHPQQQNSQVAYWPFSFTPEQFRRLPVQMQAKAEGFIEGLLAQAAAQETEEEKNNARAERIAKVEAKPYSHA
jgi:hypothetical protein